MKKIITILCLALLLPVTMADTNVTVNVTSGEDVNFWANCYATGDCNYWLDGQGFPEYVDQRVIDTKFSVWDLVNHLETTTKCFLGEKKHCSEWNFRIFNALASMFVTRSEYYDSNSNFDTRIAFLERTMEVSNAENYCQGKIDVMTERDLEWVKCGNTTYYNNNRGVGISITEV